MKTVKCESTYTHVDGYPVYVMPSKPARKCEQVWGSKKFSVANMGAKAIGLANQGINKRKHG